MKFRTRLILMYSGLLMAVVVIFGVSVYTAMDAALVNAVDRSLDDTANQVILNSRVAPVGTYGSPNRTLVRLPQLDIFRASGVGVQVWNMQYPQPTWEDSSNNLIDYREPLDPQSLGTDVTVYNDVPVNNGQTLRVLTRPMRFGSQLIANVQVAAFLDTVNAARRGMVLVIVSGSLMALVVSLMIGAWAASQVLRPIEQITQAAHTIARTDNLSTRLEQSGPMDELGRLTSVFNHMMDRLQDLFRVQQRFVADVSHELRTPLTTIHGNIDLIKRYGADDISIEAIESEAERMSRMVNDLLLLAKADYGGLQLDLEPIDLDTIMIEAHRQAQVLVKDRDLQVIMPQIEPVRVMGNADRMKQLLLNLISNAIKFTRDEGEIRLRLHREGNVAKIAVEDTGIGIAEEDLGRIFDRFFQADTSRNRMDDQIGSSGLGLSIAKWIVEAHHGTITVESVVDQGTVFHVSLPILEERPQTTITPTRTPPERGAWLRGWRKGWRPDR